jgi:hypothetical protein
MPSTIKIRILQAKDLPVMDSKSKLADVFVTVNTKIKMKFIFSNICLFQYMKLYVHIFLFFIFFIFVQMKLGDTKSEKTSICKKTLNPVWNEDFRLEIHDDLLLQDEPLELK